MGESLNEVMKDMRKTCEEFMGEFKPEEMDTSELREQISKSITSAEVAKVYFQEAFTAVQETIANEIGTALTLMTQKNYDEAFILLRNVRDELVDNLVENEKECPTWKK